MNSLEIRSVPRLVRAVVQMGLGCAVISDPDATDISTANRATAEQPSWPALSLLKIPSAPRLELVGEAKSFDCDRNRTWPPSGSDGAGFDQEMCGRRHIGCCGGSQWSVRKVTPRGAGGFVLPKMIFVRPWQRSDGTSQDFHFAFSAASRAGRGRNS